MPKLRLLIGLLALALLTSCGEKEQLTLPLFEPPILTGYHLRDANGQALGNVGAPNTNTSTDPPGIANPLLEFFSFPNPSNGSSFSVAIFTGIDTGEAVRIWLTAASYIDELDSSNTLGASVVSSDGPPIRDFNLQLQEGFNNLAVNTQELPAGYYRIYLQRGSLLLWDNLLIQQ